MMEILASFLTHSSFFLMLMFFIKSLSSFVKAAMFVNRNYVTNDAAAFAKKYLTTALKIIL